VFRAFGGRDRLPIDLYDDLSADQTGLRGGRPGLNAQGYGSALLTEAERVGPIFGQGGQKHSGPLGRDGSRIAGPPPTARPALSRIGRLFLNRQLQSLRLPSANDLKIDRLIQRQVRNASLQLTEVSDLLTADADDRVLGLEPALGGRAVRED